MEAEDVVDLPASRNSDMEVQKNGLESVNGLPEANPVVDSDENVKKNLDVEKDLDLTERDCRTVSDQYCGETLTEKVCNGVDMNVESEVVDEKVSIQNERLIHSATLDVSSRSGVKRPRPTSAEQQPTVHVTYNHLTRASKQKLETLLQQWSEWEAECNPLTQDQEQQSVSGEETYFPALRVGLQKTSSVSFWIDNQTSSQQPLKEFVLEESSTTPLYDRKFAIGLNSTDGSVNLEGGLEIIDDPPRCFNCGGYSHSLRDCPKPFDRSAVNSARKHQKAKRNQNSGPRLPSRYYQTLQGGKYDGLKPGTLDVETRQLLSIGELDPPPWLNRMREIGYPPGYLAPEDDHLSGITIFGEEETTEEVVEGEDGEILEKASPPEPKKKMTVEFPGINAPFPENADEWLWEAGPSNVESHRSSSRWQHKTSRGHDHHRSALPRDYRDDGPLGVESSSYPPKYGNRYDYGHSSKDYSSRARSPGIDRSLSERSKRKYSYDPNFEDRDRDRDWDDRERDRDRDRDDRDWSYRISSRR